MNASYGHCTCSQALIALLFRPSHDSKLRQTWSVIHRCRQGLGRKLNSSAESVHPDVLFLQGGVTRVVPLMTTLVGGLAGGKVINGRSHVSRGVLHFM